ncbi:glutamate decarboxylase [Leptobacterium flavescens]|uniref:Glutamate decarboxylase n=1 Tax=Leptobacterium flavescens TaxID=472055 RepID=A0A6P0UP38_9FLAO|nr:glutamate decarboxylase [Leptobacterium flavescens]NER13708.1 glutamate decarboxylase [Leptobacterium flavescens]
MKSTDKISLYNFPEGGMDPLDAYGEITRELALDGNIHLDLGSFSTTTAHPYAEKLIAGQWGKNFIDFSEYPQTKEIHDRIICMLSDLLNADDHGIGTATIGSSEAVILGLLAHKWLWKKRRREEGKPDSSPNLVYGENAHICWDKFAKYFDVEARKISFYRDGSYDPDAIRELLDENTICVGAVLGDTYTGNVDKVCRLNDLLQQVNQENGWDIGIHLDAAIGGFILPFLEEFQCEKWDFRLPLLRSINLSGHKFGLVYPGVGWLLFRGKDYLPEELIFRSSYLGGTVESYNLNFSRGSSMILMQYFNFLSLGKKGYRKVLRKYMDKAAYLRALIRDSECFQLVDSGVLPVVAFRTREEGNGSLNALADKMRGLNWMLPVYELPEGGTRICRVVVKENLSEALIEKFAGDLLRCYKLLTNTKHNENA